MTAEIAIMNASAVALAADSAITFAGHKTYKSGNKLFSLSDTKPRAAMIYGNAAVNGVPWETVLKRYRSERGTGACPSVQDIGRDLLTYVATVFAFPETCADNHFSALMKTELIGPLREQVDEVVRQKTSGGATISREQIRRIVAALVTKTARAKAAKELLPGLDEQDVERFQSTFDRAIDESIDEVFSGLPLPAQARSTLRSLAARVCLLGDDAGVDSGLVVAGFGDSDIFPSVVEYTVRGVANGKALFREKEHTAIDAECNAAVLAFAQEEEVCTFMEGIDPAYQRLIEGYVSFALDKFVGEVETELSGLEAKEKRRLIKRLKKLAADIRSSGGEVLAEYRRERKWGPVISAVAALPKDEMAAMAESLVNLTSLKRRVSMDLETVGGPIDVAVISLAEGLVWIKRKQYFPAELNRQFFARRYS